MRESRKRTGPVLLWTATGLLAALVLGWYALDSEKSEARFAACPPASPPADAVVADLNRATAPELEELPGIGPVLAERIVAWREEHGPFREPADVTAVSGVGPAVYEAIKPYVESEQEGGEP